MLDGFLRVQTLWDETMAENIVRELTEQGPEHRMVVMAGGNHIRFGFGIPRRVYRRLPTSFTLIGSREIVIPEERQDRLMNVKPPLFPMPAYDYLQYTAYETLPGERVKLGVKIRDTDGGVVVDGVVPDSPADRAGVRMGDVITAMGEASIKDNFDLVYEVNQQFSGDQTTLTIERDGQRIPLQVIFTPFSAGKGHDVGPRPDR
jgi:membrane-associated protease RseP (regulator of RpoE activity)